LRETFGLKREIGENCVVRGFMIYISYQILGYQMRMGEMGRICGTNGGEEKNMVCIGAEPEAERPLVRRRERKKKKKPVLQKEIWAS
jgi:hypothetical protein